MQEDFIKLLVDDADITQTLNPNNSHSEANAYWIQLPDGSDYPALRLTTIGELDDLNQDGPTNLIATRVQFDFFGADSEINGGGYAQTRLAYRAVKKKFQPIGGIYPRFTVGNTLFKQVLYDNSRDMPSRDLPGGKRVFHLEADFIVWHREIT